MGKIIIGLAVLQSCSLLVLPFRPYALTPLRLYAFMPLPRAHTLAQLFK